MLAAPLMITILMWMVFVNLTSYFGLLKGYLISFIAYWLICCFLLSLYALGGIKSLVSLFRSVGPRFGDKPDLTLSLISWPLVIVVFYSFIPQLKLLTFPVVVLSIGLGFVNGLAEEILWRGVYIRLFKGNVWLNHIYPSFGFAIWHICPISVIATRFSGGIYSFLIVSLLIGLSWGYYARKTDSVRWCTIMHVAFDSLGMGGLLYAGWFQ